MAQQVSLVGTRAIQFGTENAFEIDPQFEVIDNALGIDVGFAGRDKQAPARPGERGLTYLPCQDRLDSRRDRCRRTVRDRATAPCRPDRRRQAASSGWHAAAGRCTRSIHLPPEPPDRAWRERIGSNGLFRVLDPSASRRDRNRWRSSCPTLPLRCAPPIPDSCPDVGRAARLFPTLAVKAHLDDQEAPRSARELTVTFPADSGAAIRRAATDATIPSHSKTK